MLTDLQKRTILAVVNVFETGKPLGDYGCVTLLQGDSGHLTYGRSQTTLASGLLHLLVKAYVEAEGALYADLLSGFLPRLDQRDVSLDFDIQLRQILHMAGDDPVMHTVQDAFFDRAYWEPALAKFQRMGFSTALGMAIVYDSFIHGSFERIAALATEAVDRPAASNERAWLRAYVAARSAWLSNHSNKLLRKTFYRTRFFEEQIGSDRWDLFLPIVVRGVALTVSLLGDKAPLPQRASAHEPDDQIILRQGDRGRAVFDVQMDLYSLGHSLAADGFFGQSTKVSVENFQKAAGLRVDGIVGPATRSAIERAKDVKVQA